MVQVLLCLTYKFEGVLKLSDGTVLRNYGVVLTCD